MRDALLLRRDDVERHHRQDGAVHGHRHAHVVERDAGEQGAHVVDRVDRDARHADIARNARMVGIVAAVGREIEGDRQALLPGREVAPVEGVRILRRREPGILAHGPRLVDVHRRVGAAQEGRQARIGVEEVESGPVLGPVGRFYRNRLRRQPGRARGLALQGHARRLPCDIGKIGYAAHDASEDALDGKKSTFGAILRCAGTQCHRAVGHRAANTAFRVMVMAGLGPAIHAFTLRHPKAWILGPRPRMTAGGPFGLFQ